MESFIKLLVAFAVFTSVLSISTASIIKPIPRSQNMQTIVQNPLYKPESNPCQFIQYTNQQIGYPYLDYNGMSDEDGHWKYCWASDPNQALQDCLNWCLNNSDCAGVTQDDYNTDDFYFPVTTTSSSQVKCSNGLSFWE